MIVGVVAIAAGLLDDTPEDDAIIDIVDAISAESAEVTDSYFAGPQAVAEVVANATERDLNPTSHIDLMRDLTTSQPNLDGVFIGYPDGGFIDVRRESDEQLRIKRIDFIDGTRVVNTDIIDSSGSIVDSFPSPDDTFDPRLRPWYENTADGTTYWTEPYIFFTSQDPGITYSVPILDSDRNTAAVVGVDIRLADLERFLDARRPSENSGAAVIDTSGNLIAGTTRLAGSADSSSIIEELLSSPPSGMGMRQVVVGEPLVVSIAPIGSDGTRLLVVDAPEADFLSGLRSTRQEVGVLAAVLGLLGVLLLMFGAATIKRYLMDLDLLASTDTLTGLRNRSSLYDEIECILETGSNVAVMTLDLDGFKAINDQFGHHGGDQALVTVAERLTASSPAGSIIARLGGDEFCVVLVDQADPEATCAQIISDASGIIDIDGYAFDLVLSAGYVQADHGTEDASRLLQRADLAMYTAKSFSGSATVQFDEQMGLRWQADIERRTEIESALDSGEMDVFFHPEVDLESGELLGAEALLRWNHPTEGVLSATHFIQDLERFDLLRRLLPTVFSKADQLAQAVSKPDQFTIRLNVSAKQLLSSELTAHLSEVLQAGHARWSIELSENTVSEAPPPALAILGRLQSLGVSVVIDDYGMGRSSLSKLATLPIDALKISPSLVRSLARDDSNNGYAVVLANLGSTIGLDVLASGIESNDQKEALVAAGYRRGQGYLFSEPVTTDEFLEQWTSVECQKAA